MSSSNWRSNASVPNLQMFLYNPPPNPIVAPLAFRPRATVKSEPETSTDIEMEDVEPEAPEDGNQMHYSRPEVLSLIGAGMVATVREEPVNHDDEGFYSQSDDCYEDVFKGPLPFDEQQEPWPVKPEALSGGSGHDIHNNDGIIYSPEIRSSPPLPALSSPLSSDTASETSWSSAIRTGSSVPTSPPTTPCPVRYKEKFKQIKFTDRTSQYFRKERVERHSPYVARARPQSNTSGSLKARLQAQSRLSSADEEAGPGDQLWNVEYRKRHPKYTDPQKFLLLTVDRWYKATDPEIAKLFNHVYRANIRATAVRAQILEIASIGIGHWSMVRQVPFDDTTGVLYRFRKDVIEEYASRLGLNFRLLAADKPVSSGTAKKSGSPSSRKKYRNMLKERKRLSLSCLEAEIISIKNGIAAAPSSSAPSTQSSWGASSGDSDIRTTSAQITPASTTPKLSPASTKNTVVPRTSSQVTPNKHAAAQASSPETTSADALLGHTPTPILGQSTLGFRAWDSTSPTTYTNTTGFISRFFSNGIGLSRAPIPWDAIHSLHQPSSPPTVQDLLTFTQTLIKGFGLSHVSMTGGEDVSTYISVSTSLLQVLKKAVEKNDDAKVAIIDLTHPVLEGRMTPAEPEIRAYKRKGMLPFRTRYKGTGEIWIWAQIPREAVVGVFDMGELERLVNGVPEVGSVLRMEVLRRCRTTPLAGQRFRNKPVRLDADTAAALGHLFHLFFKPGIRNLVRPDYIRQLAHLFVNGWYLDAPVDDDAAMRRLAEAFLLEFRWYGPRAQKQDLVDAWIEGIRSGVVDVEYWSNRSSGLTSGSRRRHKNTHHLRSRM